MHEADPEGSRDDVAVLQDRFANFARHAERDSPLYATIAGAVATDARIAGLLNNAPPEQRQPVLWLAAVHDSLLRDPDHPLAAHYPTVSTDPHPPALAPELLARFVDERRDELVSTLRLRRTQTNEVGRCSILLPVFHTIGASVGPLHHVDVGTSAGLNLLLSQYEYRYDPGGVVGGPSPVVLSCATRDGFVVPPAMPPVTSAVGLDPEPVDLADPVAARWLTACVWPDQRERFERLRAAIDVARRHGVAVRSGSATEPADVRAVVAEAAGGSHPIVTTSWVLNYLDPDGRRSFVATLDELGTARDLSAVFVEHPGLCPELPGIPDRANGLAPPDGPTAVVLVTWRNGRRTATHVADAHPHGRWIRPEPGWLGRPA